MAASSIITTGTITVLLNSDGNFTYNDELKPGPLQIENTSAVTQLIVNFNSQGNTITNANNYIILNSSKITIDGQNIPINFNVVNYAGFIRKVIYAHADVIVQNVKINVVGGNLINDAGWVVRTASIRMTVNSCFSNGPIPNGGGGIVGAVAISVNVNYCGSSGNINTDGGGIVGKLMNSYAGEIVPVVNSTISNCYSTGTIGNNAGGIAGRGMAGGRTTLHTTAVTLIQRCYSTGTISGTDAGGICGLFCNYIPGNSNSSCRIQNCYSLGNITGTSAGGIYGNAAGGFITAGSAETSATNCYSVGTISGSGAGGIFGGNASTGATVKCVASTCYSLKTGPLFGTGNNGSISISCYDTANGTWNDDNANAALNYSGNPTPWMRVATNTPYLLSDFSSWDYSLGPVPAGFLYSFIQQLTPTFAVSGYYSSHLDDPTIFPNTGYIYGYFQEQVSAINSISATLGTINISTNGNFFTYDGNNILPPLLIQNANSLTGPPLTINFNSNNGADFLRNSYITLDSDYIIFNGQGVPINVSVPNYPGFLRKTGTFNNITIQNVVVNTITSSATLLSGGGWIGQTGWNGGIFVNCASNGPIAANGGGILGSFVNNVICTNCLSSGTITTGAGGMFGANSQNNFASACFYDSRIAGSGSSGNTYINCFKNTATQQTVLAYTPDLDVEQD